VALKERQWQRWWRSDRELEEVGTRQTRGDCQNEGRIDDVKRAQVMSRGVTLDEGDNCEVVQGVGRNRSARANGTCGI